MMRSVPQREIADEVLVRPGTDAARRIAADIVSAPTGGQCAAKLLAIVERKSEISRRVTFAAMRQRFGQVGAAIPLRAFIGMWLKALISIEQGRPNAHRPALIEGKGQIIRLVGQIDGHEGE